MIVFLILGTGLVVVGAWRVTSRIRGGAWAPPRWLSLTRAGADALAWIAGGALSILIAAGGAQSGLWALACIWICLAATLVSWSSSRLLLAIRSAGDARLRVFLIRWTRSALRRVGVAAQSGARIIAPTGWRELRIGFLPLERLLGPGAMMRGYLLGLIFVPVLLALSLTWALNSGSMPQRRAVGAYIGYNALAVVSCLTVALVLTFIAMVILTYSGALLIRLDIRGAFLTIAVWAGNGTAAGLVTAALLPFMWQLMPNSYPTTQGDPVALTPQLLVDVPAAFAVIGYLIGSALAVVALCRAAENLFLRRFVAPAVLVAVLAGLVHSGFGPSGILRALTGSMPDVGIDRCTEDAILENLDRPAWLLKSLDVCGDSEIYFQNQPFLWSIGIFIGVFALVAFAGDFRREARAAAAAARSGAIARDVTPNRS